ncbi:MAG TPA: ATP-binding protein [Candidatus Deferrimicrobiaceae bacterium]
MKFVLLVAASAILVNGIFGYLNLSFQEKRLDMIMMKNAHHLSETIEKSIQNDMMENRKQEAYRIMATIGNQKGIEKVRIYNPEGVILFSTNASEISTMVDKRAEACYACHAEAKPLERLASSERSRIFSSGHGHRVLGIINPLYNTEKACSTSYCHFHAAEQKILGVIDITMSLEEVDREIGKARNETIVFNILLILVISASVVAIFMRFVGKPVKELVLGTKRVANGDLAHSIPVKTDDEMGHLAESFNRMTESLQKANEEIHGLIRNLEEKVEERTRELKDAQQQLLQSEKLAAVGKIAATVAHEINNPLAGVFTYIKLMERRLEKKSDGDTEKFREYLSTMGREVERTSAIVHNLLDLTRQMEPSKKLCDLNRLIEESLVIVQNKLKLHNVEVENRMDPLQSMNVDPSQMKQVFINVFVNAAEAMRDGGRLVVRTFRKPGDHSAVLEFEDTGVGIPPEIMDKIFDPFYTTKEKGTGLGLSVVASIIRRHEGRVEVKSEMGKGTLIRITLPVQ